MSFQNSFGPDGSININVVPSFGRIVQIPEQQKVVTVNYLTCRFLKYKHGELEREHLELLLQTSIQKGMSHSALNKLSRIQSAMNTFTNMLNDLDSAEDSDFDLNSKIFVKFFYFCFWIALFYETEALQPYVYQNG